MCCESGDKSNAATDPGSRRNRRTGLCIHEKLTSAARRDIVLRSASGIWGASFVERGAFRPSQFFDTLTDRVEAEAKPNAIHTTGRANVGRAARWAKSN